MRHTGNIMPRLVSDTGKRTIAHHLSEATRAVGKEVVDAFRQADDVRQHMGLGWYALHGVTPKAEDRR